MIWIIALHDFGGLLPRSDQNCWENHHDNEILHRGSIGRAIDDGDRHGPKATIPHATKPTKSAREAFGMLPLVVAPRVKHSHIYNGGSQTVMRAVCLGTAMLFAMTHSALAESKWLEGKRLYVSEIRTLCERVSDVRLLARMQMISSGNNRWRRLSRQELVIEVVMMGVPPFDPDRCYAIARAGTPDDMERRAFEVLDFVNSTEQTWIFVVGRSYDLPPDGVPFQLPMWR